MKKLFVHRRTRVAIVLFSLILLVVLLIKPLNDRWGLLGPTSPGQNAADHYNADRLLLHSPMSVVRLVNPKVGSNVLDLGAGYGFFTIPLGHAVGDSGRVFATDPDVRALAFVNEFAKKENLRNVLTVTVNPEGVDSFYTRHTFDVIFASEMIFLIKEPFALFSQLRDSLREETGRLWVVDVRLDPDFTLWEFGDSRGLLGILRPLGDGSPVTRRLRDDVRNTLAGDVSGEKAKGIAVQAIADLNRMLDDPSLWAEVLQARLPLNSREGWLRQRLVEVLKRSRSTGAGKLEGSGRVALRLLNRLALQDLLRSYRWEKAFKTFDRDDDLGLLTALAWLDSGQDFLGFFSRAGYSLVREHPDFPYYYIGEFKRERKP